MEGKSFFGWVEWGEGGISITIDFAPPPSLFEEDDTLLTWVQRLKRKNIFLSMVASVEWVKRILWRKFDPDFLCYFLAAAAAAGEQKGHNCEMLNFKSSNFLWDRFSSNIKKAQQDEGKILEIVKITIMLVPLPWKKVWIKSWLGIRIVWNWNDRKWEHRHPAVRTHP